MIIMLSGSTVPIRLLTFYRSYSSCERQVAEHSPKGLVGLANNPAFNVDDIQWGRIEKANVDATPSHRHRWPMPSVKSCASCAEFVRTIRGLRRQKVNADCF